MRLSRYEQETIINFNYGSPTAYIHTRMRAVMRHLENKLGLDPVTIHRDSEGKIYGKDYEMPKTFIGLPRKPRQLSDERRKQIADTLARARAKKKG